MCKMVGPETNVYYVPSPPNYRRSCLLVAITYVIYTLATLGLCTMFPLIYMRDSSHHVFLIIMMSIIGIITVVGHLIYIITLIYYTIMLRK